MNFTFSQAANLVIQVIALGVLCSVAWNSHGHFTPQNTQTAIVAIGSVAGGFCRSLLNRNAGNVGGFGNAPDTKAVAKSEGVQ